MALREELEIEGNWLFRHRSYLPLALALPMLLAMRDIRWPLGSHALQETWECFCLAVSLLGLGIRCKTIGHTPSATSGRNTNGQLAATLNTTGMYSVVRHPLYLGNFTIWLGIAMFSMNLWLVAVVVLVFWLYYERIIFAEEEFLRRKFGTEFEEWAQCTPAIVPRLSGWKTPSLPFSLRNVLKREYTGLLGIVACFFGLELVEHYVVEGRLVWEPHYLVLGALAVATFLVLRTLKRRTRWLHVEGR
jgi:protein-S-isoprenylcysteine O-methyltransferase Ste14